MIKKKPCEKCRHPVLTPDGATPICNDCDPDPKRIGERQDALLVALHDHMVEEQAKVEENIEKARNYLRLLHAIAAHLDTMTEYLQEAHEDEIANDHGGDDPGTCSYCKALDRSRELLARYKKEMEG